MSEHQPTTDAPMPAPTVAAAPSRGDQVATAIGSIVLVLLGLFAAGMAGLIVMVTDACGEPCPESQVDAVVVGYELLVLLSVALGIGSAYLPRFRGPSNAWKPFGAATIILVGWPVAWGIASGIVAQAQ